MFRNPHGFLLRHRLTFLLVSVLVLVCFGGASPRGIPPAQASTDSSLSTTPASVTSQASPPRIDVDGNEDTVTLWSSRSRTVTAPPTDSSSSGVTPNASSPPPYSPPSAGQLSPAQNSGASGTESKPRCYKRRSRTNHRVSVVVCPISRDPLGQPAPQGSDLGAQPTTDEIIEQFMTTVRARGSGLVVQPERIAFTGIPTLAHASSPTQVLSTRVFNETVEISLTATQFSFDFGDKSPPVTSPVPGAPWPDQTISHSFSLPAKQRHVTLTTTWSGEITNPFTGEHRVIPNLVTTVERSQAITVTHPYTRVTSSAPKTHP